MCIAGAASSTTRLLTCSRSAVCVVGKNPKTDWSSDARVRGHGLEPRNDAERRFQILAARGRDQKRGSRGRLARRDGNGPIRIFGQWFLSVSIPQHGTELLKWHVSFYTSHIDQIRRAAAMVYKVYSRSM